MFNSHNLRVQNFFELLGSAKQDGLQACIANARSKNNFYFISLSFFKFGKRLIFINFEFA